MSIITAPIEVVDKRWFCGLLIIYKSLFWFLKFLWERVSVSGAKHIHGLLCLRLSTRNETAAPSRGWGGGGRQRGSGRSLLPEYQLEPEDLQRIEALQAEQIAYEDVCILWLLVLYCSDINNNNTQTLLHVSVYTYICFFECIQYVLDLSYQVSAWEKRMCILTKGQMTDIK